MNKWCVPSQDNLVLPPGVAASLTVLVSAAAAIWGGHSSQKT